MLNIADGDRHAPNCVNLSVHKNDAIHETAPCVGGVLLRGEQTLCTQALCKVCSYANAACNMAWSSGCTEVARYSR